MPLTKLDHRAALVIVDLQKSVLRADTKPFSAADVLNRNITLADAFRERGLPVFLVRTTGLPPGRTDVSQLRVRHHSPQAPTGLDATAVDPALQAGPYYLITKKTWAAFTGTDLHQNLHDLGVTHVVITGIATSLGVESTARAGHEIGYHVSLVTDAMTDRDAELHHNSTTKIFPRLAETGSCAELLALLRR